MKLPPPAAVPAWLLLAPTMAMSQTPTSTPGSDSALDSLLGGAAPVIASIFSSIGGQTLIVPSVIVVAGSTVDVPSLVFPTQPAPPASTYESTTVSTSTSSSASSSGTTLGSSTTSRTATSRTTTSHTPTSRTSTSRTSTLATQTSPAASTSSVAGASSETSSSKGLTTAGKVGVIIGTMVAVLALALLGLLSLLCWRRRRRARDATSRDAEKEPSLYDPEEESEAQERRRWFSRPGNPLGWFKHVRSTQSISSGTHVPGDAAVPFIAGAVAGVAAARHGHESVNGNDLDLSRRSRSYYAPEEDMTDMTANGAAFARPSPGRLSQEGQSSPEQSRISLDGHRQYSPVPNPFARTPPRPGSFSSTLSSSTLIPPTSVWWSGAGVDHRQPLSALPEERNLIKRKPVPASIQTTGIRSVGRRRSMSPSVSPLDHGPAPLVPDRSPRRRPSRARLHHLSNPELGRFGSPILVSPATSELFGGQWRAGAAPGVRREWN